METLFGMRSSALREVFCECIETFITSKKNLLFIFRSSLMNEQVQKYADAILGKDAPLDCCIGFINYKKIKIFLPRGNGSLQRSVYSCHKRFHSLIYHTITTPNGMIFHM